MAGWDDFLDEFFRRPGRDGPDLGVLDGLSPDQREQAIDLLIGVATGGNIHAIQGLGYLRADRAAEPLRSIMRGSDGVVRVYAAAALWWLRRDPEALGALCRETVGPDSGRWTAGFASLRPLAARMHRPRLRGAPHRPHAAAILSQIDEHQARRALAQVIHDSEYELRYHAYEGLAGVLGRRREFWNYVCKPDVHHHVRGRIDAVLRRAGLTS